MTINPIDLITGLITPPEAQRDSGPIDLPQSDDPEALRQVAIRARKLALAAVDSKTIDALREDAADLDDLADALETRRPVT